MVENSVLPSYRMKVMVCLYKSLLELYSKQKRVLMRIKLFVLLCFITKADCCDDENKSRNTRVKPNMISSIQEDPEKALEVASKSQKSESVTDDDVISGSEEDESAVAFASAKNDEDDWFAEYDTPDRAISPGTLAYLQAAAAKRLKQVTENYSSSPY
jgi:hypothetical protein